MKAINWILDLAGMVAVCFVMQVISQNQEERMQVRYAELYKAYVDSCNVITAERTKQFGGFVLKSVPEKRFNPATWKNQ